jgi:hypothetical protein
MFEGDVLGSPLVKLVDLVVLDVHEMWAVLDAGFGG